MSSFTKNSDLLIICRYSSQGHLIMSFDKKNWFTLTCEISSRQVKSKSYQFTMYTRGDVFIVGYSFTVCTPRSYCE